MAADAAVLRIMDQTEMAREETGTGNTAEEPRPLNAEAAAWWRRDSDLEPWDRRCRGDRISSLRVGWVGRGVGVVSEGGWEGDWVRSGDGVYRDVDSRVEGVTVADSGSGSMVILVLIMLVRTVGEGKGKGDIVTVPIGFVNSRVP